MTRPGWVDPSTHERGFDLDGEPELRGVDFMRDAFSITAHEDGSITIEINRGPCVALNREQSAALRDFLKETP